MGAMSLQGRSRGRGQREPALRVSGFGWFGGPAGSVARARGSTQAETRAPSPGLCCPWALSSRLTAVRSSRKARVADGSRLPETGGVSDG